MQCCSGDISTNLDGGSRIELETEGSGCFYYLLWSWCEARVIGYWRWSEEVQFAILHTRGFSRIQVERVNWEVSDIFVTVVMDMAHRVEELSWHPYLNWNWIRAPYLNSKNTARNCQTFLITRSSWHSLTCELKLPRHSPPSQRSPCVMKQEESTTQVSRIFRHNSDAIASFVSQRSTHFMFVLTSSH